MEDALRRGGAAVTRVFFDEWHYVLLTGISEDNVLIFDPYYREEPFAQAPDIQMIFDQPCRCNRIVPKRYFNQEALELYAFGPAETREAVLLFNEQSKLTAEETVEYMI